MLIILYIIIMRIYRSLPDKLTIKGTTFVRKDIPFDSNMIKELFKAKLKRLKYRRIKVMSKNLEGRIDYHGKPYEPTEHLYVENKS